MKTFNLKLALMVSAVIKSVPQAFRNLIVCLAFALPISSSFYSCEDFVDVKLVDTHVTSEFVFSNDASAKAALANIYSSMNVSAPSFASGGRTSITFLQGLAADELIPFSPTGESYYLNNVLPSDGNVSSIWGKCYNLIYAANAILEGLTNSSEVTSATKKQLEGEARFIRAFCYFYLVNLWGDVPYIESTDYRINSKVSRTPASQVYQNIVTDLLKAKELLDDNYPSPGRVRPNKWAAAALLSRTYLYTADWLSAEEEATAIIGNTSMYKLTDLGQVFLKNSTEAIWQLFPAVGNNNSYDGETFRLTSTPQWTALSNNLYNSFEVGDKRKVNWVGSIAVGTTTYTYPYKYKKYPTDPESEYSMILRLAEQYLIRAEARAQLNKLSDAILDVDAIRARADLPLIATNNPSITQSNLLLAIEQERRVELFTEWGHRWFDLRRMGRADIVLDPLKSGWDATDILLPLPESEILVNQNIKQNPGY